MSRRIVRRLAQLEHAGRRVEGKPKQVVRPPPRLAPLLVLAVGDKGARRAPAERSRVVPRVRVARLHLVESRVALVTALGGRDQPVEHLDADEGAVAVGCLLARDVAHPHARVRREAELAQPDAVTRERRQAANRPAGDRPGRPLLSDPDVPNLEHHFAAPAAAAFGSAARSHATQSGTARLSSTYTAASPSALCDGGGSGSDTDSERVPPPSPTPPAPSPSPPSALSNGDAPKPPVPGFEHRRRNRLAIAAHLERAHLCDAGVDDGGGQLDRDIARRLRLRRHAHHQRLHAAQVEVARRRSPREGAAAAGGRGGGGVAAVGGGGRTVLGRAVGGRGGGGAPERAPILARSSSTVAPTCAAPPRCARAVAARAPAARVRRRAAADARARGGRARARRATVGGAASRGASGSVNARIWRSRSTWAGGSVAGASAARSSSGHEHAEGPLGLGGATRRVHAAAAPSDDAGAAGCAAPSTTSKSSQRSVRRAGPSARARRREHGGERRDSRSQSASSGANGTSSADRAPLVVAAAVHRRRRHKRRRRRGVARAARPAAEESDDALREALTGERW